MLPDQSHHSGNDCSPAATAQGCCQEQTTITRITYKEVEYSMLSKVNVGELAQLAVAAATGAVCSKNDQLEVPAAAAPELV